MTEEQLKETASQLRKPHGENGLKVAEWMSKGNKQIIYDTLSILKAGDGDNILELGMADGFFVKEILSLHQNITYNGCDFSEVMVGAAEQLNSEWIKTGRAKFIHSDIASLPFKDNSFTKVFTINTIYFWDDENAILKETKRVLESNGTLIIALRPKNQIEKYPFAKYGFKLFSNEDIVKLLSDNGFTISQVIENNEPDFNMNGEILKMQNLIVVAQKI